MPDEVNGHIFRATLGRDTLADLLARRFGPTAVAIVRRADDADFVPFNSAEADALLGGWTEGQLFDTESEVRWRAGEGVYEVLLLTERGDAPAEFSELRGSPFAAVVPSSDDTHGFMLWGTDRVSEGWLETRIPRLLRYPAGAKKPPRLAYLLYERDKAVRWVRFAGLKEVG
jgi:hypothetical protein